MPKRARVSLEEEVFSAGAEHVYADNGHVSTLSADDQAAAVVKTPESTALASAVDPSVLLGSEETRNTAHGQCGDNPPVVGGLFPPAADDPPLTTIHNLVGTCEISSSVMPIDLEFVYRSLPNSFYDRKRFAAITIRVTQPVCTGLLFTSGKLVVTGCKTLVVSLAPAPPPPLPSPTSLTLQPRPVCCTPRHSDQPPRHMLSCRNARWRLSRSCGCCSGTSRQLRFLYETRSCRMSWRTWSFRCSPGSAST